MSTWLQNFYNGAALSGGFRLQAAEAQDEGKVRAGQQALGTWHFTPKQRATLAYYQQKVGASQREVFAAAYFLYYIDSIALQIFRLKAHIAEAWREGSDATQYKQQLQNIRATSRATLTELVGKPKTYAMYKILRKIMHKPRGPTGEDMEFLLSDRTAYNRKSALHWLPKPMTQVTYDRIQQKLTPKRAAIKQKGDAYRAFMKRFKDEHLSFPLAI